MIKATISLVQVGSKLIPAGRGYQPSANFNRGDVIGEYIDYSTNDKGIKVKTESNEILFVEHENYIYEEN